MSKTKDCLKKIAHDVFWGQGDSDHPDCPKCGATMSFCGGDDVPVGEGYWKCMSCGYSFCEDDLEDFDVSIY